MEYIRIWAGGAVLVRREIKSVTRGNCELYKYQFYIQEIGWTNPNKVRDEPGPCLNIKTVLSTYGDFHVKDKTAVRTSYL